MKHWAIIDDTGAIISFGTDNQEIIDLMLVRENQTLVERPEGVTGFENWRLINGEWALLSEAEGTQ